LTSRSQGKGVENELMFSFLIFLIITLGEEVILAYVAFCTKWAAILALLHKIYFLGIFM